MIPACGSNSGINHLAGRVLFALLLVGGPTAGSRSPAGLGGRSLRRRRFSRCTFTSCSAAHFGGRGSTFAMVVLGQAGRPSAWRCGSFRWAALAGVRCVGPQIWGRRDRFWPWRSAGPSVADPSRVEGKRGPAPPGSACRLRVATTASAAGRPASPSESPVWADVLLRALNSYIRLERMSGPGQSSGRPGIADDLAVSVLGPIALFLMAAGHGTCSRSGKPGQAQGAVNKFIDNWIERSHQGAWRLNDAGEEMKVRYAKTRRGGCSHLRAADHGGVQISGPARQWAHADGWPARR